MKLRPHLKTAKSPDVARIATKGHFGGITVSTLREAEYFFEHGVTDVTYAICVSPAKLQDVMELRKRGLNLHIITDDVQVARQITNFGMRNRCKFSVFIEVDSGYGRSGVLPTSEALLDIAKILHESWSVELSGVLTHAGHSYAQKSVEAIRKVANDEVVRIVSAAERVRSLSIPCPEVSIGSTPTFTYATSFEGVTELRPGNYMFLDLAMAGRRVCTLEDIAVSVVTTVIVTLPDRNRVLVDAGALALSKDVGVSGSEFGYGLARTVDNSRNFGETGQYCVRNVCQEQGWIGATGGNLVDVGEFSIGDRLRILPNHACMTSSAYDRYYVVGGGIEIVDEWERCNGW